MIIFNEDTHSYINSDGEVYTSITSLIKKFCKPFNKYEIAKKYAKKHKRKEEDVLAEWAKAGQDAIRKGTFYHKMQEDILLSKKEVEIDGSSHPIFPCAYLDNGDKITKSQKLESGIYPELCVWSDKYQVAGQADYVEITASGKINISDYKTSKEIKKEGYKRAWDGHVDRLKMPLRHLDDCNFNHYALQLNLYAFLIKQHNRKLKIGKLIIKHIIGEFDETTNKFTLTAIVEYPVPNMQNEVKDLLEYFKTYPELCL